MIPYWYKEAIIYEVHVKCFFDSSGDGIGDFHGLTQKLDYLADLGVSAIWILPFYPSPLKDDGYDIADYTDVHSRYGNLKDFREFLRQAHLRHLKVIIELVINHTSDQHPWFQRARRKDALSDERNFYVWSDTPDKYKQARIIFQDFEPSNWTWDQETQSYYWHRFYGHQPDLNYDHPAVHRAVLQNLSFWFKMGVDGMRLDAVPYLYEREGTNCENLPETHAFLKKLRNYVDTHFPDRMLLAEANQWPEDAAKYFGEGDECHMAFHFPVMPRLFMAIHLEDSLPIVEIMAQTPTIPDNCQWALFLRNHDELTLEMVTDEERDYMYRVYAYDPQARLNLGIRRRLAPLLKNDRRKIELMNVLLFSLNGTPVLYYGDEIGMGDNIYLGDRNGVRTPMQWSNDRNAGFSRANPQQLYLPPIIDPEYHFETVNVEAQLNNPHSLLWWTKQLIALRKRYKAFSYGKTIFLKTENRKILVFFREHENELLLIIANLSRFSQYVELDLKKFNGYSVIEMFSGERFPSIGELPYFLTLGSHGYYWFALQKQEEKSVLEQQEQRRERQIHALTFSGPIESFFYPQKRRLLDGILRKYLFKRSWFRHYLPNLDRRLNIADHGMVEKQSRMHLVFIHLTLINGISRQIPLFLHVLQEETSKEILENHPENCVALIQTSKSELILFDCSTQDAISHYLRECILQQKKIKTEEGELRGVKLAEITERSVVRRFSVLEEEMEPDIEVRLFLTRKTSFKSFLPLVGYLEYKGQHLKEIALAEISDPPSAELDTKSVFIEGATHFFQRMETIQEKFQDTILLPTDTLCGLAFGNFDLATRELLGEFPEVAHLLGQTTADFHSTMWSASYDPNFFPIGFTLFYQRSLYQVMWRKVNEGFSKLEKTQRFTELLSYKERLLKCMAHFPKVLLHLGRVRTHGNYVLENLYYTGREFLIANFGADHSLSLEERRYKRSPLRDVVAMLLSMTEASFEAVDKMQQRGLIHESHIETFKQWALGWSIWIGSSFLRAYLRRLDNPDFLPEKRQEIDFVIGIFLLERCVEKIARPNASIEAACYLIKYWLPIYETLKL